MSTIDPSNPLSFQPRVHSESIKKNADSPESKTIQSFFDSIAARYDFLNYVLSFRLDDRWRKKAQKLILDDRYESLLDLGIGTGKFTQIFLADHPWRRCVGLDFSSQMLEEARRQLSSSAEFVSADFLKLPFQPQSFDLIISAFTLRSVKNMEIFLRQVYNLLQPNGKAAFLCLTRPKNFFFKLLYYPYLKLYLPLVGGIVSGNRQAYEFLSNSILNFQAPETTASMMKSLGFDDVQIHRFTFGAATLIMGRK